jgi:hypothetical protein
MSKRLQKLRREVDGMRKRMGAIRGDELIAIAKKLGRKKVNRGKEPTYEIAGRYPLTIPGHPGTLAVGTAASILNQLDDDLVALEENEEEQQLTEAAQQLDASEDDGGEDE